MIESGRNRNLNRPINTKNIQSVIKKLPTNISLGPDSFTENVEKRENVGGIVNWYSPYGK